MQSLLHICSLAWRSEFARGVLLFQSFYLGAIRKEEQASPGVFIESAGRWSVWFVRPSGPGGGSMIIAQGKAAALCSAHPTSSLPFFLDCRAGPPAGAAIQEKGEECILHA